MKNKLISFILVLCLLIAIPLEARYKYNPFTRKLDYYETGADIDLGDLADVTLTGLATGNVLYYDGSAWVNLATGANTQFLTLAAGIPAWQAIPAGVVTFLGLTDAPNNYAGANSYMVRVNAGANALVFGAESAIDHDGLTNWAANKHVVLPGMIANVLSDHTLLVHTTLGLFDASSDVDHNQTTNYAADQHVVLPGTLANVLSDHDLAAHTILGLFDASSDVDHNQTTNYVSNQHIDWTGATQNMITSGYVKANGVIINDDKDLYLGTSGEFRGFWDPNTGGDDLVVFQMVQHADNTTVIWLSETGISPNGFTTHDSYLSPTFLMVNAETPDLYDYAGVIIGERGQSDISAAHYFDFWAFVDSADGVVDANTTEVAAIFRFGPSGSEAPHFATTPGDVLFEGSAEINRSFKVHSHATTDRVWFYMGEEEGTEDQPYVKIQDAREGATVDEYGESSLVIEAEGYGLAVIAGDIYFEADIEITENFIATWVSNSDHLEINMTNVTGTDGQPLINIDDDRTGAYANSKEEATIVMNAAGSYALWVDTGDVYFDNDFEVYFDSSAGNINIYQPNEAQTEDVALVTITSEAEGATVDEPSEALLKLVTENYNSWAFYVQSGIVEIGDDFLLNWSGSLDHAVITQTDTTGTDGQPLIEIDDDRTGTYANTVGEATIVLNAAGSYAFYVQTGIAQFDGNAYFTEDVELNWSDAADIMSIYQASATQVENIPLVHITSEAEGTTVDENLEAVLRLTTETNASWALFVEEGKAEFEGDFLVNWDAALDKMVIAQTAEAGTEDQPLIFIDDDRTGVTAQEQSEATIYMDVEGIYAIYVLDGQVGFQSTYMYAASGLKADDALWSHGAGDDILIKWDVNGIQDDLYTFSTNTASAASTAALFYSEWTLNPSGMTDHNDYLTPTFVIANWEAADANDYAGVVIGERAQASVLVAHYFDFYAMTGAVDGSPDGNAVELAAIFRFGANGTGVPGSATTPGDVLIEGNLEVDGVIYADGGILHVMSKEVNFDDGSPVAICDVADGYMVTCVIVEITTTWDGNGTIVVGDGNDPDGYMEDGNITQGAVAYYGWHHDERGSYLWHSAGGGTGHDDCLIYTGADTVDATLVAGTSTQGIATVYVHMIRLK